MKAQKPWRRLRSAEKWSLTSASKKEFSGSPAIKGINHILAKDFPSPKFLNDNIYTIRPLQQKSLLHIWDSQQSLSILREIYLENETLMLSFLQWL